MKEMLYYYYQIIIENNDIKDNTFSFNNHLFLIYKYTRNINELNDLYNLNLYMLNNNIKINKIIKTKDNNIIFKYKNENYILIEILYKYDNYISYNINAFNNLKRNNYNKIWSSRIDYILNKYKNTQNKLIKKSLYYYINLSENAITYYNLLNIKENIYIMHRRINIKDLFNPIELVLDYKIRDISEYIKYIFFNDLNTIDEIINYIKKINLDYNNSLLLYVRLLYPTYYFDNLDNNIENIINKKDNYEMLLYKIYKLIKTKYNIIGIEWINNKY